MRVWMFALAFSVLATGCTHMSLERNTVNQVGTLSDLRYRQVMNNLAMFAANPSGLPHFGILSAGSTQVADQGQASSMTVWERAGFKEETLGLQASRELQENWTLDPVRDPEKLEAMRCAFHWALGVPQAQCDECAKILHDFKVVDRLSKIQAGWLHIGCKKDVPKEACYRARCGETYVWVMADGMEGLSQLTLALLDIATLDLSTLAVATPTRTVTTEVFEYDPTDSTRVKRVIKTTRVEEVESVRVGVPAPPAVFRPRIQYQGVDAGIRSLINLRR